MQKTPKTNFKAFLNEIRKKAKNEREKGTFFERAIRDFLKQAPEYSFENVWLWTSWPDLRKYGFSKKDLGIDLVAKEKETGTFWAIQCKCFDESYQVNKTDIDSFFTHSGKNPFKVRLIVTTTNNWGPNAEESLKNQTKECKVLDLHDLETADFEWSFQKVKRKQIKKYLRDHQRETVRKSEEHFKKSNRGKLIMACGTGKTFTSLRIVEKITPKNGYVLFLCPSISLISQTLREYAWQRKKPQRYLAVCSDVKVGKDHDGYDINDLQISPTTNPTRIAERLKLKSGQRTVVFSTYQSLDKIKKAQNLGAPEFDLVICDEAHRTTGVEAREGENGQNTGNYFTRINDKNYVKTKKRLYMTATPKIYSEKLKSKARKYEVEIHSMDEESVYGKEIYRLDFSNAIEKKLLADYKVIILTIDEQYMSDNIQEVLQGTELNLEDASRLVGCYKALRDQGNKKEGIKLSRAVGFLNTIKASKNVKQEFAKVVKVLDNHKNDGFTCETEHIDGTDSSIIRNKKLDWLKEDAGQTEREEKICRILLNSKCLTEGIDVPNLDAVIFLHPRKSQVDVVQAVGRIMRKQEGKNYGYVILPVVIPAGKSPEKALNDNETYKVVWQVLNALRSHDSRFNAIINNLDLNESKSDKIKVVGIGCGGESEDEKEEVRGDPDNLPFPFPIKEIEEKIYAKIVEKCGDRIYEEKWAKEIEKACNTISIRIKSLLKTKPAIKKEFQQYYKGLKASINEDIREKEAVSMLAEHLITRPAFDKIFENYKFSENNPVSKTMKKVLDQLDQYGFRNELKDLEKFYKGVSNRLDGIDNSASRQKIIKELYENFIRTAFPKTAEKLGVAYTPIEIVDFILRSADEILKDEFNKGLTDEGVHIIDPFVGTGTFINRLIQMNPVIEKKDLPRKFQKELHANDILLLPYYVASINIEEAYHSRMGGGYKQFPGITLTDTFNIYESKDNVISLPLFKENKERIKRQKKATIRVIVGNPPYSGGQRSENDANKNTVHPSLHKNIKETYVKESEASNKNALYDSYIKAVRWATDRIGDEGGIIGFVHNASLVNERSIAGLRKSLVKEFDSIYCFNLRGNQRTKGELSKKEGGKVFGGSSRAPIAITFLVRNPENKKAKAQIKYYDIGDYLSREEKLEKVKNFGCVKGMGKNWQTIVPDKYGDWVNQRDESFYQFMPIGDKKSGNQNSIFGLYSQGIKTHRDSWVYNFNKNQVQKNTKNTIQFYNQELERLKNEDLNTKNIDQFINLNEKKIKWSCRMKENLIKNRKLLFEENCIRQSNYRPFVKSYLYFENNLNERRYQLPKIFPKANEQNKVICVSGVGSKTFSVLMTDVIPDVGFMPSGQCFPLYRFDEQSNDTQKSLFDKHPESKSQKSLIDENGSSYSITDSALNRFRNHYQNNSSSPNKGKKEQKSKNWHLHKNELLKQKPPSHPPINSNLTHNREPVLVTSGSTALKMTQESFNQPHPDSVSQERTDAFPQDKDSIIPNRFEDAGSYKREAPKKQDQYKLITKEDIFYYIYGLLHSEDYRKKYKSNLDKDLPRIPLVPEFWEFSNTGRKLADLHLNYENRIPPEEVKVLKQGREIDISSLFADLKSQKNQTDSHAVPPAFMRDKPQSPSLPSKDSHLNRNPEALRNGNFKEGNPKQDQSEIRNKKSKSHSEKAGTLPFQTARCSLPENLRQEDLKVQKMKYNKQDKTKIQFNDQITISNIPKEAWEYKINGWSSPKWIVERYQYKQDQKTDLVNDPNTYSNDPAYVLKLLLSVITVSLKTQELVQSLPPIDFDSFTTSMDKTS